VSAKFFSATVQNCRTLCVACQLTSQDLDILGVSLYGNSNRFTKHGSVGYPSYTARGIVGKYTHGKMLNKLYNMDYQLFG